jgi:cell division protein FtsZ
VADAIASLKLCPLLHTPEFSRKADRLLVNIMGGADLTLPKVNELMTAIAEQFGRESHIIMGAVIDEDMAARVEVCIIGTSDMGGRAGNSRRPLPNTGRSRPPIAVTSPATAGETAAVDEPKAAKPTPAPEPVPAKASAAKAAHVPNAAQDEFGFGEVESRGHFEKTDRNLFDGQDLDVPTYLRRGIKISL